MLMGKSVQQPNLHVASNVLIYFIQFLIQDYGSSKFSSLLSQFW